MANQPLNKNYLIASVLIHLFIMFGVSYMIKRDALSNKNFVIFGAHSRHTTKALYKSSAVPFTGGPSRSSSRKGTKGKGTQGKKSNRTNKKLQKKNSRTPVVKKSQTPRAAQHSLKKLKQLGSMPSPTAMVEDKIHPPSKKSLKKKTVQKKVPPSLPAVDEFEHSTAPPAEHPQPDPAEEKIPSPEVPAHNEQVSTDDSEAPHDGQEGEDDGEAIHVGVVDSTDPVTRYHQRVIGQEFSRLWQPPVGVRKGTECTVRISIDAKGSISNVEFIKRSQVPIYDLSILRLKIAKPEFPASLHGKHMIVVFHQ